MLSLARLQEKYDMQDQGDTFIYLIKNLETGRHKIGKSDDPDKRCSELQVGNDCELKVIAQVRVKNGHIVERELHKMFHSLRQREKWFNLEEALIDEYKHAILVKADEIERSLQENRCKICTDLPITFHDRESYEKHLKTHVSLYACRLINNEPLSFTRTKKERTLFWKAREADIFEKLRNDDPEIIAKIIANKQSRRDGLDDQFRIMG